MWHLISTAYGANGSVGMGIAVVVSLYEDRGKRAVVAEEGTGTSLLLRQEKIILSTAPGKTLGLNAESNSWIVGRNFQERRCVFHWEYASSHNQVTTWEAVT